MVLAEVVNHNYQNADTDDPLASFTWCFDPNEHSENGSTLVKALLDRRKNIAPATIRRGMGRAAILCGVMLTDEVPVPEREVCGPDLLFVDALHADIDPAPIPLATDRHDELRDFVDNDTRAAADEIVAVATAAVGASEDSAKLREHITGLTNVAISPDMPPEIVAALLMAYMGHEGQTRINENRAYLSHVTGTALLYVKAWEQIAEQNHATMPDEKYLQQQIVANLLHDVVENDITRENAGSSQLYDPKTHITFRLLREVFSRFETTYAHDDTTASDLVHDIKRVTKTRGIDGETLPSDLYQAQAVETIRSAITKFCDTVFNKLIDPKIVSESSIQQQEKLRKTHAEYDLILKKATAALGTSMSDAFGVQCVKIIEAIGENPEEFRAEIFGEKPISLWPSRVTTPSRVA